MRAHAVFAAKLGGGVDWLRGNRTVGQSPINYVELPISQQHPDKPQNGNYQDDNCQLRDQCASLLETFSCKQTARTDERSALNVTEIILAVLPS